MMTSANGTVVLVGGGSRGDCQPLIVLGAELQRRGRKIVLIDGIESKPFCDRHGFTFCEAGSLRTELQTNVGMQASLEEDDMESWSELWRTFEATSARKGWASLMTLVPVEEDVACVVGIGLSFPKAHTFARALALRRSSSSSSSRKDGARGMEIVVAAVFVIPMAPTTAWPHPFCKPGAMQPASYLKSHAEVNAASYRSLSPGIAAYEEACGLTVVANTTNSSRTTANLATGAERLDARPAYFDEVVEGRHPSILTLNAFSSTLCGGGGGLLALPAAPLGPLLPAPQHYAGDDGAPGSMLAAFISAGPPPIYVGFGSMNIVNRAQLLREVLQALKQLSKRAVVLGGWAKLSARVLRDSGEATDQILADYADQACYFAAGSLAHAHLFPQCEALVFHGGASTFETALRSGVPMVIAPLAFDQYFLADRAEQLGCGVAVPRIGTFVAADLVGAINTVTCSQTIISTAKAVAAKANTEMNAAVAGTAAVEACIAQVASAALLQRAGASAAAAAAPSSTADEGGTEEGEPQKRSVRARIFCGPGCEQVAVAAARVRGGWLSSVSSAAPQLVWVLQDDGSDMLHTWLASAASASCLNNTAILSEKDSLALLAPRMRERSLETVVIEGGVRGVEAWARAAFTTVGNAGSAGSANNAGTKQQRVWILKDPLANSGHGLYVVSKHNWRSVTERARLQYRSAADVTFVAQEYVERPMLWGSTGCKFHFRVYAVLRGDMELLVYRKAFAHVANKPWKLEFDAAGKGFDSEIHITNVAANAKGGAAPAAGYPSEQLDIERPAVWHRICCKLSDAVQAATPFLLQQRRAADFVHVGADFLLDADCEPWLLEFNVPPCLGSQAESGGAASAVDNLVGPMLNEFLELLRPLLLPTRVGECDDGGGGVGGRDKVGCGGGGGGSGAGAGDATAFGGGAAAVTAAAAGSGGNTMHDGNGEPTPKHWVPVRPPRAHFEPASAEKLHLNSKAWEAYRSETIRAQQQKTIKAEHGQKQAAAAPPAPPAPPALSALATKQGWLRKIQFAAAGTTADADLDAAEEPEQHAKRIRMTDAAADQGHCTNV